MEDGGHKGTKKDGEESPGKLCTKRSASSLASTPPPSPQLHCFLSVTDVLLNHEGEKASGKRDL